jgi:hypothetical protein
MADGAVMPDGTYDAFVIDANADGAVMHLELAVIAGDRKGDVVTVAATGLDRDELDLVGLPATITVAGGQPAVAIDG